MEPNDLIAFGGEIKALGDGRIGGYLVRYTDDKRPDLEGDFFTADTDYDVTNGDAVTIYYAHGQDPVIKNRKLGKGSVNIDDVGVWVEAQLALRDEYERAIYGLVEAGKVGWSSGTLAHLVERVPQGSAYWLKSWPLGKDASLTPTPAAGPELTQVVTFKAWQDANPNLKALRPEALGDSAADATAGGAEPLETNPSDNMENTMSEINDAVAQAVKEAMAAEREAQAAAAKAESDRQAEIDKARAEAVAEYKAGLANEAPQNEPGHSAPNVAKHGDVWKYDNYPAADLATTLEYVGQSKGSKRMGPEGAKMAKALALRLESSEADDESVRTGPSMNEVKTAGPLKVARSHMKSAGIKANETNFSTNASYGDEWIGVAYSGQLWEQVRTAADIARRVPSFEFPAGAESLVIPLESTDPIWYLVAQAGDPASATAAFTNTVPAKGLGTAQTTMTLGKLGSSTLYTGEMVEDAMLPFVAQLRSQIATSAAEYLDSAIIDGDTATTASTNINDIAGTPGSTDWFLIWNGFRKSPLVTTTANSRDGGVLASSDFLETVKLMGAAGKVAYDKRRTSFIIDPATHWKSLELVDVKSRDVFANPTIESGMLTGIFGYEVLTSYHMHFSSTVNTGYEYKTNTAGKVDIDTASNNTKGVILAVRWDYWTLGYRRRLTTEVERVPRADGWEITSLLRAGLVQRDTEASAISYNLTV